MYGKALSAAVGVIVPLSCAGRGSCATLRTQPAPKSRFVLCFEPRLLTVYVLGSPPLSVYATAALIGATLAAVVVYGLGLLGRGGPTPLRLTLAGVVPSKAATALTGAES